MKTVNVFLVIDFILCMCFLLKGGSSFTLILTQKTRVFPVSLAVLMIGNRANPQVL